MARRVGSDGPVELLARPVVATAEELREADVEALAAQLYVEMALTHKDRGKTSEYLAKECFVLATEFVTVRDERRKAARASSTVEKAE
jgi:hypothetical protein